jgi:hypothetical protein
MRIAKIARHMLTTKWPIEKRNIGRVRGTMVLAHLLMEKRHYDVSTGLIKEYLEQFMLQKTVRDKAIIFVEATKKIENLYIDRKNRFESIKKLIENQINRRRKEIRKKVLQTSKRGQKI